TQIRDSGNPVQLSLASSVHEFVRIALRIAATTGRMFSGLPANRVPHRRLRHPSLSPTVLATALWAASGVLLTRCASIYGLSVPHPTAFCQPPFFSTTKKFFKNRFLGIFVILGIDFSANMRYSTIIPWRKRIFSPQQQGG
ncbi:MAG: hypothetical protein IJZ13_01110, partial [Clostridia bacterium]|nr:hypothetical protein [Clostridia bacterium]